MWRQQVACPPARVSLRRDLIPHAAALLLSLSFARIHALPPCLRCSSAGLAVVLPFTMRASCSPRMAFQETDRGDRLCPCCSLQPALPLRLGARFQC